ncbi:hypothetical protein DY000_02023574 [Brassica cretica]|uniref:Uncharacterized protein n=1 Tax=Brassica cretica TaxID=69181 RepID=A0ABQ7EH87_BRACR|nr:hypothetical protein DY000_02023574 [Brassica cretica]
MLSLPSGQEYRDVAVRAGGVCEPANRRQQDHHASAEAPPSTTPLMRTSPHISIPIYLCFLLPSHTDTMHLAQRFSVSALSIDDEVLTSIDSNALMSIDRELYISIDTRDRWVRTFFSLV